MNPPVVSDFLPAIGPVLPEMVLGVGALVLVLIGALRGERSTTLVNGVAMLVLAIAGMLVVDGGGGRTLVFGGSYVVDGFGAFMKVLTILGSMAALLLSLDFMRREGIDRFEYGILVVIATLGMFMMISAHDLIGLYLGIELQSLSLYVVAAINRDQLKSSEAGLKYFVLGALSSGMLLYGMSFIYGFTGGVAYDAIAAAARGPQGFGVIFGIVFLAAGLAFKMSAVPFHMWTPDVYEGAPTPVAAFIAGAPKLAAVAMTTRALVESFPAIGPQWQQIITFISIASMVLGAFGAIGQSNLKRLMAYSAIGNVGYALVGLAANTQPGVAGVAVYMAIYLATTLGMFACILAMRTETNRLESVDDLGGLSRTRPWLAFVMAAFLFSLIGIPPLAGFWGKWYVFVAAINAQLYTLAVIGVLASVVSAFYYLRLIKVMYFDEARETFVPIPIGERAVLLASGGLVLAIGLFPGPLQGAATAAARSLF